MYGFVNYLCLVYLMRMNDLILKCMYNVRKSILNVNIAISVTQTKKYLY